MDFDAYYDHPCQCIYWHNGWRFGIAYHEFIIDSEKGEVFLNKDLALAADCDLNWIKEGYDDWIDELEWFNLREHKIDDGVFMNNG